MTFAMTISLDLVVWAQSDAPVVRRQFTGAIRSITGSLAANQLMAKELALHIFRLSLGLGSEGNARLPCEAQGRYGTTATNVGRAIWNL
jgi:hypothetical protein